MRKTRVRKIIAVLLAVLLSMAATAVAAEADSDSVTGDKGTDMLVDLVVMRPLGVAATVVGAAAFVVGLPFTVPSGSVGKSACVLVTRPADYTFKRPLGEFNDCGSDCRVCNTP
jgi:hypothetical protein